MKRVVVAMIVLAAAPASAHKPSDAHLQLALAGDRLTGTLAVAIRDLDGALGLDYDGNGTITWAETTTAATRIATYASERLAIAAGGEPCSYGFGPGALADFSDGAYWTVSITGTCSGSGTLIVTYKLLFDIDAQHRGIVSVRGATSTQTAVARSAEPIRFELDATSSARLFGSGLATAITRPELVVVLICLVLPIAWQRKSLRATSRAAGTSFAAFAIGNLATMLLATTGLVALPAQFVAIAVAGSVVVIAAANLLRVDEGRVELAFELGLVHGFAIATWIAGPAPHLAPVLGFGLGVVVAEAIVVAAIVPVLAAIEKTLAYQALLWGGSVAAAIAGAVWTLQSC